MLSVATASRSSTAEAQLDVCLVWRHVEYYCPAQNTATTIPPPSHVAAGSRRWPVARRVGKTLDDGADSAWLWKGRPVYMFDGTTASMPDTLDNQAAYPQVYNQKPGLGFPIARICSIILSCGAMLDLGISLYAGKGQGELSLLRQLWDIPSPGDILGLFLNSVRGLTGARPSDC